MEGINYELPQIQYLLKHQHDQIFIQGRGAGEPGKSDVARPMKSGWPSSIYLLHNEPRPSFRAGCYSLYRTCFHSDEWEEASLWAPG